MLDRVDGKYHAMHTGELLVHNLESSDQFSSYTCQMMHTLTRKVTTSSPANIVVHGKNLNYDGAWIEHQVA